MNSKFDIILEYVRDIPEMKADIRDLKTRVGRLEEKQEIMNQLLKRDRRDLDRLIRIHPNLQHS